MTQIGSQNASFSKQVADIQRLMQKSGLKYQMHATGTTVGMSSATFGCSQCLNGLRRDGRYKIHDFDRDLSGVYNLTLRHVPSANGYG